MIFYYRIEKKSLIKYVRKIYLNLSKFGRLGIHLAQKFINLLSLNSDRICIAINILNDYNYRNQLITKYLTIYQIIESFMYKIAIVKLESESRDGIFSIRNFKRLYKTIVEKESVPLRFTVVFACDNSKQLRASKYWSSQTCVFALKL